MKKRLLTLAMSAIMVLGLSTTAFASETNPSPDASGNYVNEVSVGVTKNVTNGLGTSAAETFYFTVEETSVTNASDAVMNDTTKASWAIEDFSITVAADETSNSVDIELPEYTSVGIYTYTISETPGNTLGVEYDESVYTMTVTVIQQGDDLVAVVSIRSTAGVKQDEEDSGDSNFSFTNIYTANSLTVSKEISGNFADPTKEFTFTVTFTNGTEKDWTNAINSANATPVSGQDNTYTFTLKGGDSLTFSNIPEGLTYTVTEDDYSSEQYSTTVNGESGRVATGDMAGKDVTAAYVNTKGTTPDTGINLDSLPYIMILGIVLLGAAYVISRRRLSDRY